MDPHFIQGRPELALSAARKGGGGFTLLELLIVLAIIGLLAGLSLPAMKSVRQSNSMVAAGRQLVDDLSLARARAIAERTVVRVVFVPPSIATMPFNPNVARDRQMGRRLKAGPYTTYALFAERSVGDQPGFPQMRYLTEWKSLPQGIFLATWEYEELAPAVWDGMASTNRPLKYLDDITFPSVGGLKHRVPCISFDPQGRLLAFNSFGERVYWDEVISLARGSILYDRDQAGEVVGFDVRESPENNSITNFHRVVVDALTGRARVETPQINP